MIKPIQRIYRIIYGLSCLKIYLNDFEKICMISTCRVSLLTPRTALFLCFLCFLCELLRAVQGSIKNMSHRKHRYSRKDTKKIFFLSISFVCREKVCNFAKKKEHNEKEIGIHSNDFQACR